MCARSFTLLTLFALLGLITKVTWTVETFDFYKTFKTPHENYEEACTELDKMEILERSNFPVEEETEQLDSKDTKDERSSASANVNVRFGNNILNNNKPGSELGNSVHYNFFMCGHPFSLMPSYGFHPFHYHHPTPPWSYNNLPVCYQNSLPNHFPVLPQSQGPFTTPPPPKATDVMSKKLAKFIETYQRENNIKVREEATETPESCTIQNEDLGDERKANFKRLAQLSDAELQKLLRLLDEDGTNVTKDPQMKNQKKRSTAFWSRDPDMVVRNILQPVPDAGVYRSTDDGFIISDNLKILAINMSEIMGMDCDCSSEERSSDKGGMEVSHDLYPAWVDHN